MVLGGLVILAIRCRWSSLAFLGLALFVAGGASNLVDRLTSGAVVDFLNVGVGRLRTGIFNVADVAIMLGAGIIALTRYRDTPAKLNS
jgi:signal peptidase II